MSKPSPLSRRSFLAASAAAAGAFAVPTILRRPAWAAEEGKPERDPLRKAGGFECQVDAFLIDESGDHSDKGHRRVFPSCRSQEICSRVVLVIEGGQ